MSTECVTSFLTFPFGHPLVFTFSLGHCTSSCLGELALNFFTSSYICNSNNSYLLILMESCWLLKTAYINLKHILGSNMHEISESICGFNSANWQMLELIKCVKVHTNDKNTRWDLPNKKLQKLFLFVSKKYLLWNVICRGAGKYMNWKGNEKKQPT